MLNSLGRNFPSLAYRGNRNGIRNERLHTPEQRDYTVIQLSESRLLMYCLALLFRDKEKHKVKGICRMNGRNGQYITGNLSEL